MIFSVVFPFFVIQSHPLLPPWVALDLSVSVESAETIQKSMTISVDFQKADIHEVIRFFSKATGVNFIVSDGVSGTVTARLINVPWEDALRAILASQGLAAQNMGSLMLIK